MKKTIANQKVTQETLGEIIQRIVEVAKSDKIVLFGSAARGKMGLNSDVDLLVIKSGNFHRGRLTEEIYMNFMNLKGVRRGVDVVVVTSEDVGKHRDDPALVIHPALTEGKVVYAASSTSAGTASPAFFRSRSSALRS